MKGEVRFYAVRKAEVRKAGTVQRRCLVLNLDGRSFGASRVEAGPGTLAHVGISKKGNWIFEWQGRLYVRYMRYELTGRASIYERHAGERERTLQSFHERLKVNISSKYPECAEYWQKLYPHFDPEVLTRRRVGGSVHLWGGDVPWGSGKGKMALKPFDGEFREDWR